MNHWWLFLLLLPALASALEGSLQARAGYFCFGSSWAHKIYGSGAPDVELEGSFKIYPCASVWSNLNYVWKEGRSSPFGENTHLDLGTVSLGANLMTPILHSSTTLYVGLGISGAYVHTSDHSSYLPRHTSQWGVGFVSKFGLSIPAPRRFFINPFFDYYYQPIHTRNTADDSTVNLGGFRTGLGLGYRF